MSSVEWVRAAHGKKIVTMPDGSELTTKMIREKLGVDNATASNRLNAYIETGDLKQLWKAKNTKRKYVKKVDVEVPETHYVEGDLKHYFDDDWKLLMRNI